MVSTTGNESPVRSGSPVATAMAILRCFTAQHPVLGVVDIAEQVGLHKSSVSRMLPTLEAEGLVERDPYSQKYRLSLGLLHIAGSLLSDLDIRRAAAPVLAEVTEATGETSSLLLWDGEAAVTVEQVPSKRAVKHAVELGTRYQTLASSSVRILVRELAAGDRAALLERLNTSEEALAELSREDDERTTVNDGLTVPDEVGVAAAVRDHRGLLVGAMMIAAPRYRVDATRRAELRTACADAAAATTSRLGGVPHAS
ncbi:ArsR family transcriptional regulator [Brachybacterium vulturis]|uniref:Glycerol operon regulatory protein n=1 Tax=Brachybacterium vulturis TaxID=2017484 RepID=A0A291GLY9_9MICO|nr:IclR family transcriptional regulator [Brachybacterium vulturis]ATG51218.1 ArsR family transcriptional regulator [Brachybacterium vulturis]